jgi:2-polyprenyl-6-methoxyphenol hydroxylase-like FAD-dependent oxidoreductase
MDRWSQGRVLLLGDSCTAILPTAGVGASSAMESAAVLADILTRSDSKDIPQALALYRQRRFPRAERLQKESRAMARYMFVRSGLVAGSRDLIMRGLSQMGMFQMIGFSKVLDDPI